MLTYGILCSFEQRRSLRPSVIPGGPKKNVPNFRMALCNRVDEINQQKKHVCNEQTSSNMSMNFHLKRFHISCDTSEIVLHVIKQRLQAFYHHRNRFLKKLMVSAGVSWNGKTEIFSSTLKRLKSTRRLILTFWRRPCCQNATVCIQTMISSSCKTALHHTTPMQLKITPDFISSQEWTLHSPDLNPLDNSVWDILQEIVYEGRREPFANLKVGWSRV